MRTAVRIHSHCRAAAGQRKAAILKLDPMSPSKQTVRLIRQCLDRLADSRRLTGDEQEEAHDGVAATLRMVPAEGILEAIDAAAGGSRRRRKEVVFILGPF